MKRLVSGEDEVVLNYFSGVHRIVLSRDAQEEIAELDPP